MSLDTRAAVLLLTALSLPAVAAAQASSPVADAFRAYEARASKNLVGAMETFPADKYGYKPTPAQRTVAEVALHLAQGNDYFCSAISGVAAPKRDSIAATAPKDQLVARLKETFSFCDSALAKLDDSGLGDELPFFGGRKVSRASMILITTGDWEDHYSQLANYLRLNGLLPPTARRSM
jgi:uncharacterized damage-inducible protein DinB